MQFFHVCIEIWYWSKFLPYITIPNSASLNSAASPNPYSGVTPFLRQFMLERYYLSIVPRGNCTKIRVKKILISWLLGDNAYSKNLLKSSKIFIPFSRRSDGRGAPLNALVAVRARKSSQASKLLERDSKRKSFIYSTNLKNYMTNDPIFSHNLLWSILFVLLVFYWIRLEIGSGNRYIL